MIVLSINCGSSSVKVALVDSKQDKVIASETIENLNTKNEESYFEAIANCDAKIRKKLKNFPEIETVVHRYVHGGSRYSKPLKISSTSLRSLEKLNSLAPLHNPYNLAGIDAARKLYPKVPHFTIFDTAFYHTLPEHNKIYALPYQLTKKHELYRYGFHGINHSYITKQAAKLLNKNSVNIISCHLGSGCSITAVKANQAVHCSMGFTPISGIPMATRSGDIDPGLLLYMQEQLKIKPEKLKKLLLKESGWLGISGISSDFRKVRDAYLKPSNQFHSQAKLTVEYFTTRVAEQILLATTHLQGRLDLLVFTGGVGEGSALIRELVISKLWPLTLKLNKKTNDSNLPEKFIAQGGSLLKPTKATVILANEALEMAREIA